MYILFNYFKIILNYDIIIGRRNIMDKTVFEANKKIEQNMYDSNLNEFKLCNDKLYLINNKYKNHNMRFSLIIDRNIAFEKGDIEFAYFLDSIINDMTNEISLLNKSLKDNSISAVLNKLSFHEKVNIIFYVRPTFYDSEFEPYEILAEETFKTLSASIIHEANCILKDYDKTLKEISLMKSKTNYVSDIIKNKDLCLDILFASELVK